MLNLLVDHWAEALFLCSGASAMWKALRYCYGQSGEIQCGFVTDASLARGWASEDATLLLYASLLMFLFLNIQDNMIPLSIQ